MPFDQTTRNRLARLVGDTRDLLDQEFTRQLQHEYGIDPKSGDVTSLDKLKHLNDRNWETARLLRDTIEHYVASSPSGGRKEAIRRIIREQAFTVLNRLCAIRMAEARGLIVESVGRGYQSKGFQLYSRLAGTALGETGDAYRCYLFSLFDELSVDLAVLFDRFSPHGRLFPREAVLLQILEQLNSPELESLWIDDETIGWIYQYFNSIEERKQMRAESQAPRNSRELAIRNQFFTPRYVVEFLTDNTLGRIWYEMRKGETALKESCRYLVRRPKEIFLAPGDKSPDSDESDKELSQEELLKRPVHIEHRPKKDPRDLKILDPAVGSGHFLLYAFDLLERIYQEAWEDTESPKSEATGHTLHTDFATPEELRKAVPELILRWNLHGIDIDPRCAQIAGLAIWLRAQRSWHQLGLKPAERPPIRKSNIVIAEPMPGETEMLKEFTSGLKPRVLGQLVEGVFDKMKLAGEAGSLLKIEDEITWSIAEAKKQWKTAPKAEQGVLFADMKKAKVIQGQLFDVSGISDEQFWEQAEDRIMVALKDYAERADNGNSMRRRLFAEDAARGFAFIDICRKRYDALLMNPPFGESTESAKDYFADCYPDSKMDAFAMFVERGTSLAIEKGMLGAITSRTGFFLSSFEKWRKKILESVGMLTAMVDLGHGIMDSAMVEAAAYCIRVVPRSRKLSSPAICIRLLNDVNKELKLMHVLAGLLEGGNTDVYCVSAEKFRRIPGFPFAYWVNENLLRTFERLSSFDAEDRGRATRCGLGTLDDFRFIRVRWEVDPRRTQGGWVPYYSGGTFSPFYEDFSTVVKWQHDGAEIKAFVTQKVGSASRKVQGEDHYFRPGFVFPRRTRAFSPKVMPAGGIFSTAGQAGFLPNPDLGWGICLLSSSACNEIISLSQGAGGAPQFEVGLVKRMPWPEPPSEIRKRLADYLETAVATKRTLDECVETSSVFLIPVVSRYPGATLAEIASHEQLERKVGTSKVASLQQEIDVIANSLYGLGPSNATNQVVSTHPTASDDSEIGDFGEDTTYLYDLIEVHVSYMLGVVVGYWDVRFAIDSLLAPRLQRPFDPLPVCAPGMLVSPEGLPAEYDKIVSKEWLSARPDAITLPPEGSIKNATIPESGYPLRVSWNGILVDDSGFEGVQQHKDDIIRRVREVLDLLWKDKAHEIEQEACEILGVSDLRDYFRKPSAFFQDHLKRYSKSRRKAPIYWPLSTMSGSHTIWIYYHRLSDQTLFNAVNEYIDPKLKQVAEDLNRLRTKKSRSSQEEKQLERLSELELELRDFRTELLRIAAFWKPNLNDGVQITAAPLWGLFRHNQWRAILKETWESLEAGEYDWAHLAYSIWPDRVREKCKTDKSLAIAHDLENLYQGPKAAPKKSRGRKSKSSQGEVALDED